MAKNTAVFGLYATPSIAESAVDHLMASGFNNADISVLLPDDDSTRAFAHQKHTKAPEGTATGGALGGVVGALVGMGIPEYEAKRYEGAVKNGGTLLSVHCDSSDAVTRAKQALKETGAKDIAASGEEAARKGTEADVNATDAVARETDWNDARVESVNDDAILRQGAIRDETDSPSRLGTQTAPPDFAAKDGLHNYTYPAATSDDKLIRERTDAEELAAAGQTERARNFPNP
jgi:hypothetical protein